MRNALRLTLGLAVSFACLYFALRGTDWPRVGEVLVRARLGWTAATVLLSLVAVYVRAQRWRVLLRPLGDIPLYPVLSATAIGFGASAVLPFRLGELVRPALLGRRVGVAVTAALSSVVLERLFDVLLVIACFLGLSLIFPLPPPLRRSAWGLAALAGLGFATLLAMQRNRVLADRLVERVLGLVPVGLARGLTPLATSFLNGLAGLADGAAVARVLAYSAFLWGVILLTFLCAMLALDIGAAWAPARLTSAALATMVIVAAFVFLPQAPGFVGTWQAGCVLALGLFGVPRELAVGYSLLTWVMQMIVNLVTAGFFLLREGFSLGQLRQIAAQEAASVEGE